MFEDWHLEYYAVSAWNGHRYNFYGDLV
jgi:hypothetical protein